MITHEESYHRVQQTMANHQLDALVAVSPWNVYYTSGTSFMTQRTIPERLALTVSVPNHETVFIYCSIEDGHARSESWLKDLRGYTEFADRPMDVLADVLREKAVSLGRIGVEQLYLVAKNHEELRESLPDATVLGADEVFDHMRAIKTVDEIALLGQAARATDAAIRTAFEQAKVGDSEISLGGRMIEAARAEGAGEELHLVLATGPNTIKAHHTPTGTRLEPGGTVRTDFGMYWGHYLSDIARTALIAPVQDRQVDIYKRLEDIHQTVISAVEPGIRANQLFNVCTKAFEERGLSFQMPHIGHSIGVKLHENPMIHPSNESTLEAGMVIMLEPSTVADGGFYHTEDMIEVTEDGHRILSRSADWSEPIIIE